MKNTILSVCLLISQAIFAQSFDKPYALQVGAYNTYTKKWVWKPSEDIDLTISIKSSTVRINDEAMTTLITFEDLGKGSGVDEDGDAYLTHKWKAYDERGRKCYFIMLFYKQLDLAIYTIAYTDYAFRYYMKRSDRIYENNNL